MKKLYRTFMDMTGLLLSFILPQNIGKTLDSMRDRIYTGFIRRRFGHFGNSVIAWGVQHLEGCEYIHIGDDTTIDKDVQLTAWKTSKSTPSINIGNNCLIRAHAHITAVGHIRIGNNLLTGTNILITDNLHGDNSLSDLQKPPREREIVSKGDISIGDNIWLGNNVCIMPGVTIGDGAVIGANSVVTHDIPAYTIAAGIPAKIIKTTQA